MDFDFGKYENLLNKSRAVGENELNRESLAQITRAQRKQADLVNSLMEKRTSWLRYLVTTISVVFGILVSLGPGNNSIHQTRFLFGLGVALLSLSILSLSISLYNEIYVMQKGTRLYYEETKRAVRDHRPTAPIAVATKRIFAICEIAGYICFVLALLALAGNVMLWAIL